MNQKLNEAIKTIEEALNNLKKTSEPEVPEKH